MIGVEVKMASGVYTVLFVVSILYLVRKKVEEEANFLPKIIGYFILGSLNLTLNEVSLPLGFFVYLLFFRPRVNIRAKQMAAYLGVFAFILTFWILPFADNQLVSLPKSIDSELGSVYEIDFKHENERIIHEIGLEEKDWKLEDFEVEYGKDSRIINLRWQLAIQNDSHFDLYKIQYDTDKSRYQVRHSEADSWLQYDRLVVAWRFFEILDGLNIKEITEAKGSYSSYIIRSSGDREGYATEDLANMTVLEGEIQELEDEELPVEGYSISSFALEKTGEERDEQGIITHESFQSVDSAVFLFDISEIEDDY
jgi:hypothetical protein